MLCFVDVKTKEKMQITEISFIIGRDSLLKCKDKKISRNHGVVNVLDSENTINIKSTHLNPIFYKLQDSIESLNILQKGEDVTLNVGDLFGLLETEFWYEICSNDGQSDEPRPSSDIPEANGTVNNVTDNVDTELIQLPEVDIPTNDALQSSESSNTITSSEQPAVDENEAPATSRISVRSIGSINATVPDKPSTVTEPPKRQIPAWMTTQPNSTNKRTVDGEAECEDSTTKRARVEDINAPSTSGLNIPVVPPPSAMPSTSSVVIKTEVKPKIEPADPSIRPSCNFGIRCYRKNNPTHATEEAHPGDSDYRRPNLPPAPKDAPPCQYGARCYRRNPRHFQEFSHPDASIYFPANPANLANVQQQIFNNKRRRTTINYTVVVNGDDDSDNGDDFSNSDDDAEFDPNKTDAESADEEDTEDV